MMDAIIDARDLVKRFDGSTAVNGLSFAVSKGTILIDGHDPVRDPHAVRRAFGIVFQDDCLDEDLSAWENMELHGLLYAMPRGPRRARIDELLAFVGLDDRRNGYVREFSGGIPQ